MSKSWIMPKPYILVILLIASLDVVEISAISEEMQELLDMLRKTCVDETGVDPSLIPRAVKGDFADDDKFKCYIKCIGVQMSLIDDDGMIDGEATIALMPPELKGVYEPVIKKCGTKIGANACENAWLTHKCYQEGVGEKYFLP